MDPSRFATLERSIRSLKTRNIVLSVLLLISLGANVAWVQAAADPPVRVYTGTLDDAGGGGSSREGDFLILPEHTRERPRRLLSVTTSHLGEHGHTCLVTASAQVSKPANTSSGTVMLGFSLGGEPGIRGGTERMAHLVQTSDENETVEEVTTTFAFRIKSKVIGYAQIRFNAAYDSGGVLTVSKPSMTVVCLTHRI